VNRKRSVPELADADRLVTMAQAVEAELGNMATLLSSLATSWGTAIN